MQQPIKKPLTLDELCDLFQVQPSWIYWQVKSGTIPYFKLGKYLRFDPDEISEWWQELKVR